MPVGKGGIQGLCKWVCVQYMCVIMGMWWYKCGVCISCMSIGVCVCVCVFVCGLHMLPITSPICVNHHRRRNRVRHSDYDLKDIREEGEPVTGPARPLCQTNFTHTSFTQFGHALHWASCAPWHVFTHYYAGFKSFECLTLFAHLLPGCLSTQLHDSFGICQRHFSFEQFQNENLCNVLHSLFI